jgi:hypothetical protein
MILFLDFDGVLHPDNVRLAQYGYSEPLVPEMLEPGFALFCWAETLASILDDEDPHGRIKIVLSTSWVNHFPDAAGYLPASVRERVIGEIKHGHLPRGALVAHHAELNAMKRWVAIDDDCKDWPVDHLDRLIRCNGKLGLSAPDVQKQLREKLRDLVLGL